MDQKMMDAGGLEARNQLFAKTREYLVAHGVSNINLEAMSSAASAAVGTYSNTDKKT